MSDDDERLPDDELDRGLAAAFGRPDPTEEAFESGPLSGRFEGALRSLFVRHDVEPRWGLDGKDERDPAAETAGDIDIRTTRYDVRGRIARGGMGAIYHVRDRDLRRSLAMKVLVSGAGAGDGPRAPERPDHLSRFLEEAQVTAQLAHPGIVPVHEVGVDAEGRVFFTMDLVRGRTLATILRLARRSAEGWTRTRALQVILRVCETLSFAHHKGVIHRDVKPDNVMVGEFGETYVMDWGLARVLARGGPSDGHRRSEDDDLSSIESRRHDDGGGWSAPLRTLDGTVVGTPAYMPPEQARGSIDDVDARADVYAVGALLYELLTGRPPYVEPDEHPTAAQIIAAVQSGPPEPVQAIDPDAPDELVAICERAMARDPAARYEGAQELGHDIQAFIEGRVVRAHRTGTLVELQKWIGRNRALAASVAAGVAITVLGSIGFALHARDAAATIAAERDKEAAARRRADGLRLAARADNEIERAPALALGLACEGVLRADGPYARTVLYSALAGLHEVATLEGHDSYVGAAAFLAGGSRLVSVSDLDGQVIVWDLERRAPLLRLDGGGEPTTHIEIAKRGDRVATASPEGRVRVWDTLQGAPLSAPSADGAVSAFAWDPEGVRLAVVTTTGRFRVQRPGDAVVDVDLQIGTSGAFAVAWRPDGRHVAVQRPDGGVLVLDAGTGAEVTTLRAHAGVTEAPARLCGVAWLDAGRKLISWRTLPPEGVQKDKSVGRAEIWDPTSGRRLRVLGGDGIRVARPLVSASGNALAFHASAGVESAPWTVVWDAVALRERCSARAKGPVMPLALSADGRHLVTTHPDFDALALWGAHAGSLVAVLRGHTYRVKGAVVTDDGLVASASADGTVRLFRAGSALDFEGIAGLDRSSESVVDLAVSRGMALVVGRPEGAAPRRECRSISDGRTLFEVPPRAVLDPTWARIAVHDAETNRLRVLDPRADRVLFDVPGPSGVVPPEHCAVAFSPDGARLFAAYPRGAEIRSARDGSRIADIALDEPPSSLTWHPDGKSVFARFGRRRIVQEYDASTGAERRRFEGGHTGYLTSFEALPGGDAFVSVAADRSLVVWSARAEVIGRLRGLHHGDVTVHVAPSGRIAVVRSPEVVILVDLERPSVLAEVPIRAPQFVAFDAENALVGTDDAVLRIPFDPLAVARAAQPRPLGPLELGQFDVGDADERAALLDAYVDWTFAPERILSIALDAVADGAIGRARGHAARLEAITPGGAERAVLEAALLLVRDDVDAALRSLERAATAGCGERPLRHSVFDALRARSRWAAVESALRR